MKANWFFLLLFPLFVVKCYYTGLTEHNEKWFSSFYDVPSAPELIENGFWVILKTVEDLDWVNVEKMWDLYDKLSEKGFF